MRTRVDSIGTALALPPRGGRLRLPRRRLVASVAGALAALASAPAGAAPPAPSGPHPRLFLTPAVLANIKANLADHASAAAGVVAACDDTIATPHDYASRGGVDGDTWPAAAVRCALAFRATGDAKYAAQSITYWRAALEDDESLGDKLGCVAGASGTWDGSGSPPPGLVTVAHDTGYPMRWYGPYVSLTYDWMHDAPGVDEALRAQTRTCLGYWIDWYSKSGYHHDEAGANYNAGFVAAKAFAAIALAGESAAPFWSEVVDDVFGALLVGKGLAGASAPVGAPAGALVGGDWAEGWQYGPLSVYEYALAARALEQAGAPQPAMDGWLDAVALRAIYGTAPDGTGQFPGGDYEGEETWLPLSRVTLMAVRAGSSSADAAGWAESVRRSMRAAPSDWVYDAIAEARSVTPIDYAASARPMFYLARGTRTLYARTSWDARALWAVFRSAPAVVSDHQHHDATNFVFARGGDPIIVDPSTYGDRGTLATNAVTLDSDNVTGDYAPSQTPWSRAELAWARGTAANVFAARGDFAGAFAFADRPSDVPFARREWVLLPEGEIVLIDRATTKDAAHGMYVDLHTRTGGTLALAGGVAAGIAGGSKVVIHAVKLSGGAPSVAAGAVGDCFGPEPFGACKAGRFAHEVYSVKVPGPNAVAVHVIDALDAASTAADATAFEDGDAFGTSVVRDAQHTFVLASAAPQGKSGATMTYAVMSAARHVVFDAPEDAAGRSNVTASVKNGTCAVTIAAGPAFAGRPLVFGVSSPADGCKVTEDAPATGAEPSGDGGTATSGDGGAADAGGGAGAPGAGDGGGQDGGCGCVAGRAGANGDPAAVLALVAARMMRRRRR